LFVLQLAAARGEMKELREKNLKAMQEQIDAMDALEKAEQRASAAEDHMRTLQVRTLALLVALMSVAFLVCVCGRSQICHLPAHTRMVLLLQHIYTLQAQLNKAQ
jgi:FtsZ-binding cell division protein ZapB